MSSQDKTSPGRSKESLIGIWIGKQVKPEVEASAIAESELTGVELNANALAKEIFLWAFPIYRQAGSLAKLKKLTAADFKPIPSPVERNLQIQETIGPHVPTKQKPKRKSA
jgi:hypothetical protein